MNLPDNLIDIQKYSHPEHSRSATHSACLTMENDFTVWSALNDLRRIDGTVTTENVRKVFYNCKVTIDEWAVGETDFAELARLFSDGVEPEALEDDVLLALKSAVIAGNGVKLTEQLERAMYAKVNKILEGLGGKWNRKLGAHVFADADPEEAIAGFIETGKLDKIEKFGFFETQPPLAAFVVRRAKIQPGEKVIEPSAGTGNLAMMAAEIVGKDNVVCYELQSKNCAALRAKGFDAVEGDFLKIIPYPAFDVCAMNPPFEKQADIDHVMHAYRFLKPGGRLVSIMSASITFRSNKKTVEFRAFLSSVGAEIIENAADAFKASGTMVRTVTIVFQKSIAADAISDRAEPVIVDSAPAPAEMAIPPSRREVEKQVCFEF
jgi:ubiquinone/menaquinone biosynthesis C-methylase UbiE